MASATSLTASSSSSLSLLPRWRYDVFLSFRGEDTRKNFTDHLYTALCQKGIITFRDDEKLERGRAISPELLKAIEESRSAIIILSKNFASSTWCLDELVKIVECMQQKSMVVYPVFYHVKPFDVRHQRESFAQAFIKYEEKFKGNTERMQGWREALTVVANLPGWDLKDSYESTIVKEIVGEMLHHLNSSCSSVSKNLFGINSRVEEIMSLCKDLSADHVCLMGIYGIGGIGKTTLARAIYRRISCEFEASAFLENVKEETKRCGLVALQKKLLSKILEEREIEIYDVEEGADMIQKRLCGKKVLLILDDVDKLKQLCALAQTRDWFGPGSKIIITTRNKRLLIEHDVAEDEIYEAKKLNYPEALQLFSWKAFKGDQPPETFVELSKEFLNYAKGHPLALEVLGSSLYRRNVDLWKSMLSKVKKLTFDGDIQGTLRVSFDALSKMEKNVFLDIACFFKGEKKDYARDILESFDYDPDIIIDDLINKSLITIRENRLWLHDLLEDMGQKIVYSESPKEPGLRSRLWLSQDIHHVLKNDTGTERIEGIVLKSTSQEELHLNPTAFFKLKNLRLLKIHNVHLSQGLSHLPNKLQVLKWLGYPLKSLPKSFTPLNVMELIMPSSCIKRIWKGKKNLYKLKILDLRDSQKLIKTPNFTGLPNLEKLFLQGCVKLHKIHPSLGSLKQLIVLNLRNCKSLEVLPCDINLDSLEILILSGCLKITKFPEVVGDMKNLSQLHLDGTAIKELPLSMEHLIGLTFLNLENCKDLLTLPSVISTLTSLKSINLYGSLIFEKMSKDQRNEEYIEELDIRGTARGQAHSCGFERQLLTSRLFSHWSLPNPDIGSVLPPLFSSLCSLSALNLSYINLSDGAILSDLSKLSSLKLLNLCGNKFEYIPESISQLSKLKLVCLDGCSKLQSVPKFAPSVQYLTSSYCTSLERNFNETDILNDNEIGSCVLKGKSLEICHYGGRHDGHLLWLQIAVDLGRVAYSLLPANGIPMLFNNLNNGCLVKLRLNRDSDDRSNWLGCALYFAFEYHGCHCGSLVHVVDSFYLETPEILVIHFDTDEGPLKEPLNLPDEQFKMGLARYCVYIPHVWFAERSYNVDRWSFIMASITLNCLGKEIHMCGGHLIYKENAQDFLQMCMGHEFHAWRWT